MTQSSSPLASPEPWELVAVDYAADVVPHFEKFAQEALRHARVGPGMRVVDVASGPGTLSLLAARAGATVSALDFAPSMIDRLHARFANAGLDGIDARVGDGTALPHDDASFDAGFSMFGLMFFPDRAKGFRELARVLVKGAPAVVSSWVPMDRIPIMALAMGTVTELLQSRSPAPSAFPLVEPEACRSEMTRGGFSDVVVHEHSASFEVPSTKALVESLQRTNAPIVMAKKRLGDRWPPVAAELQKRLTAQFGAGPHTIAMPANLIVGRRGSLPNVGDERV